MKIILIIILATSLTYQGCASIFKGPKCSVRLESKPQGAKILVDEVLVGETPRVLELYSKKNYFVKFRMDGYAEATIFLRAEAITLWVILDIFPGILLGPIPILADALSGSWNTLEPNDVFLELQPVTITQ